jgi:hypothetical protein
MSVEAPPGLPGWLKVSLVIAGVIVVGLLMLAAFGVGGPHGPGMHSP